MTVTRGEGVKISENVADVIYGSPILGTYLGREKKMLRDAAAQHEMAFFLLRLPLNHVVDIGHQASPDATLIFGASAKPLTRVFSVWVRLSSFSG